MKELTLLEQMLLAAIVALREDAYGVSIRKRGEHLTGKRLMYGTLYNARDQLVRKGYGTRKNEKTFSGRGGRPRIYYSDRAGRPSAVPPICTARSGRAFPIF